MPKRRFLTETYVFYSQTFFVCSIFNLVCTHGIKNVYKLLLKKTSNIQNRKEFDKYCLKEVSTNRWFYDTST